MYKVRVCRNTFAIADRLNPSGSGKLGALHLWRSVKYEEVYLRAYGSVSEARASIGRYLTFYNGRRPHSSLDRKTPDHVYFNQPLLAAA